MEGRLHQQDHVVGEAWAGRHGALPSMMTGPLTNSVSWEMNHGTPLQLGVEF